MKLKLIMVGLLIGQWCWAQQFSEKITKEYTFEKATPDNAIMVANINGNVKVTGYEGTKIMVEVNRSIYAKTDARLEKGKQEIKLGVIDRADTLIFFVEEGCNQFGRKINGKNHNGSFNNGWGYNWDCRERNCRTEYDYKMDFTIKVPAGVHLMVSTINDGDIVVENVKGTVDANNINGSIKLSNLMREADASTINGDVDIEYTTNPAKDCRFYSLNGDINALFQKGLSASLSFESFNGSFYTNIDDLQPLPVRVEKMEKEGDGVKFKVNGNRYQVGKAGGAYLDFETFNGNVYLKEKIN
jgi:putative adhesin